MHFEVNLLQLLRALLDMRVHLKKRVLLKICASVGYLKSQFEFVVRKKEKFGPTCNAGENANEKKCVSCIEGWVPSPTCIGDGHEDSVREHRLK